MKQKLKQKVQITTIFDNLPHPNNNDTENVNNGPSEENNIIDTENVNNGPREESHIIEPQRRYNLRRNIREPQRLGWRTDYIIFDNI